MLPLLLDCCCQHCHVISGSGWACLGGGPNSPQVQMRTRCDPAVFQAAVEQVQQGCCGDFKTFTGSTLTVQVSVSCMCLHAQTRSVLCIPYTKKAVFYLFCIVVAILLPLVYLVFPLLSCWRNVREKVGSVLVLTAVKAIIWAKFIQGKLLHIVGSFNTNIGGNNLCIPAASYTLNSLGLNSLQAHTHTA